MSKKSRKKSPKTSSSQPAQAKSPTGLDARAARSSRVPAKTSSRKRLGETSHNAAPKPLKSPSSPAAAKPRNKSSSMEKTHQLSAGVKAPSFRLPRDGGGMISLSDFSGKKLVLFFYPRADTPGCTREAIDFTRLKGDFAQAGTEVLGISGDSLKAQESFRDKHKLGVALVSDEKHQMLEAYGAWGEKSMYGRTFLGILRTTVLIGADGHIARIWRQVKVEGHADDVLAAARSLSRGPEPTFPEN
ncbi:MAG: peroxiredoxin [Bradyrhizobium sp.]|nr:peroxiredoxin [Bradyrhizobium sp.]